MELYKPDTQHVVVEEDFRFEPNLDQVGDHFHVICAVCVAVHAQRHEKVLGRSSQLFTQNSKVINTYNLTSNVSSKIMY